MMSAIRVLVANQPRLMRELVLATISEQPDIEVVGQVQDDAEIERAVRETHPDFVIVALDNSDRLPPPCRVLLKQHPHLRVIAIAPNRESTMCYWTSFNIESNRIESSEESVLSALRGKVQLTEG
jgi:AmiR/NasT family two-component response regulator